MPGTWQAVAFNGGQSQREHCLLVPFSHLLCMLLAVFGRRRTPIFRMHARRPRKTNVLLLNLLLSFLRDILCKRHSH